MQIGGIALEKMWERGDLVCHRGDVELSPGDLTVNPNSINVTLSEFALKPSYPMVIDPHDPGTLSWKEIEFSELHIRPGDFYLMSVRERFSFSGSYALAPMIEGRSTLARCGLCVHESAGFGDVGFKGNFTLEVTAKLPIILRPGDEIAQVFFEEVFQPKAYEGAYSKQGYKPEPPVLGKHRFVRDAECSMRSLLKGK